MASLRHPIHTSSLACLLLVLGALWALDRALAAGPALVRAPTVALRILADAPALAAAVGDGFLDPRAPGALAVLRLPASGGRWGLAVPGFGVEGRGAPPEAQVRVWGLALGHGAVLSVDGRRAPSPWAEPEDGGSCPGRAAPPPACS